MSLRRVHEALWTPAPQDCGLITGTWGLMQEELGKKWREELSKEGGKGNLVIRS